MSYSELIFLDGDQLVEVMAGLDDEPDRIEAHQQADRLMCAALHKASAGELSEQQALSVISLFMSLEKWYG